MTTKPHHTFLRAIGHLADKDRATEWWTVTDFDAFCAGRDAIPFANLYCHEGRGGLVVYLDRPRLA
jgi:hypothetical protein